MTFKPTKACQRAWIKKHLNNGVCPKHRYQHRASFFNLPMWPHNAGDPVPACYEALDWLSSTNIATLEEAWDRCTVPDWLIWTVCWMKPGTRDIRKALRLLNYICTRTIYADIASKSRAVIRARSISTPERILSETYNVVHLLAHPEHERAVFKDTALTPDVLTDKIKKLWRNPWKLQ